MGESHSFWRHWLRGGRALLLLGITLFMNVLAAAFAVVFFLLGLDWLAGHFLSQHIPPDNFLIAAGVLVVSLIILPANVSHDEDDRTLMPSWRLAPPSLPPRDVPIELAQGFRFLDGVLCEQARPERNERWTLVGAYGSAVVVPGFPKQLSISGILNVETTKTFLDPVHVRFRFDDREILRVEIRADEYKGSWTIGLAPRLIDITGAGTIHVDISMDGGTWVEVLRKRVLAGYYDRDGVFVPAD